MSIELNDFSVSIKSGKPDQSGSTNNTYAFKKLGKYNYVSLPNYSLYKIKLTNNRNTRCDAEVKIDGVSVGTWRIPSFDSILIERPANINRRFVFFRQDSHVAKKAGIEKNSPFNGVISVTFKPELQMNYPHNIGDDYNQISGYIKTPTYYEKWNYGFDKSPLQTDIDFSAPVYRNSGASVENEMNLNMNTTMDIYSSNISYSDNNTYVSGATMLGSGTDQQFNTANKLFKYDSDQITNINLRLVVAVPKIPKTTLVKGIKRYMPIPPKIDNGNHYIPVSNLTDRYYNSDQTLIEKPYIGSHWIEDGLW